MEKLNQEHRSILTRSLMLGSIALGVSTIVIGAKSEWDLHNINPDNIVATPKDLPAKLPAAVRAEENDVVSIIGPGEIASGFLYSRDSLITAGHVIDQVGGNIKPGINNCGSILASSPMGSYVANKQSTSFWNYDSLNVPDFSLLKVKQIGHHVTAASYPDIYNGHERIGTKVFFINYEPVVNDGHLRNPVINFPGKYSKPAIYGGIIEGYQQNGNYLVVDNLKSYGAVKSSVSIPGSSGGPVFNSQGEVIGIVVTIMPKTIGNKILTFFANLDNTLGQTSYSGNLNRGLTVVEPLNHKIIEKHEDSLKRLANC